MTPVPDSFYFIPTELGAVPLNDDGTFVLKIELDSAVSAMLEVCHEVTTVLLNPGDDIHVTLNSKLFDETVSYTGKGAEKNNQVARMSLMREDVAAKFPDLKSITDTAEIRKTINDAYGNFKQVLHDYVSHNLPVLNMRSRSWTRWNQRLIMKLRQY